MQRIIITGPESTGKSVLSQELAQHFNGSIVPEYARQYLSELHRNYRMEDVLEIARVQLKEYSESRFAGNIVFFDTWLIITKVWLEVVYKREEKWIDEAILSTQGDHYLLCYPDIEWIPDPLRENGGKMRDVLFQRYKEILIEKGLTYTIIKGVGPVRTNKAIFAVEEHIKNHSQGDKSIPRKNT